MGLFNSLSGLILRQVFAEQAESLLVFLNDRMTDNARRLERVLYRSNERAWRVLEIALAGPTLWQAACDLIGSRDDKLLRKQVQAFLDRLPGYPGPFRQSCLRELKSARRVKLVPGTAPGAYDITGELETFARYGDPAWVMEQEREALEKISQVLAREGYPLLARYVELRPCGTDTLLVWAARYFFRRELECDSRLANALTLDHLEGTRLELMRFQQMVAATLRLQNEELQRLQALLRDWAERSLTDKTPVQQAPPKNKRLLSELFDPPAPQQR
ncbi:MAG: hypothetical protein SNJ82_05835 [Gemmataceae bacterium]